MNEIKYKEIKGDEMDLNEYNKNKNGSRSKITDMKMFGSESEKQLVNMKSVYRRRFRGRIMNAVRGVVSILLSISLFTSFTTWKKTEIGIHNIYRFIYICLCN